MVGNNFDIVGVETDLHCAHCDKKVAVKQITVREDHV